MSPITSRRFRQDVLTARMQPMFEPLEGRRLLSAALTTLASFAGSDGSYPQGSVVADSSGNLYGTTSTGGTDGDGSVYDIKAGSGTIATLVSFNSTNGDYPVAGLTIDSAGNLFGTTEYGGANNIGTVFEIAAGSSTVTTLATFDATDSTVNGYEPDSSLVTDLAGNLYGRTSYGGADNDGTIFKVAAVGGTITTLASLDGTNPKATGVSVDGSLTMDSSGNLYGTIYAGGTAAEGSIFELASGASAITTLAAFDYTDGEEPESNLVIDSAGNLYGTAGAGGANYDGVVFELPAGSGTINDLAAFNNTNGYDPLGNLIMDSASNLYGTSYGGGAGSDGTLFEVASQSQAITTLVSFDSTDGNGPTGLATDSAGDLFGTTYVGGASSEGAVFELPDSTSGGGTTGGDGTTGGGSPSSGVGMVPAIASDTVPPSIIAGQTIRGGLKIKLTDSLSTVEKGYVVKIYASAGSILDTGTATLITSVKKTSSVKAGKSVTLSVPVSKLPASLASGNYFLIAQSLDSSGNVPYAATNSSISVAAPYVALSATASPVKPATIAIGKSGSVTISITNSGNITATGSLIVTLSPSTDGATQLLGTTLVSTSIRTSIKPKKTGRFTLHFKVPATLAAGAYYTFVSLSLDGGSTSAIGAAFSVT